jgi:regulator of cell morphogenesis and NO signaling
VITQQTHIAEIAAGSLAAIRVFMRHEIDFCCGGKRPLAEICEKKGLDPNGLIGELDAAMRESVADDVDWNTRSTEDLIRQIVNRHHAYLRSELPRLSAWLSKVYRKYGEQDAAILEGLPEIFERMKTELDAHLTKEEVMLFPYILNPAGRPYPTFAGPLQCMEAEHDSVGEVLTTIRRMTLNFTPPPHACTTYKALFAGLAELEADLMLHIHLENNVLFPRVRGC